MVLLPGQHQSPSSQKVLPVAAAAAAAAAAARRENFEISLRDKNDATAKRAFRVQVPKRMLTYTVCIFFVAPLFLFGYFQVHTRAIHHQANHHGDVKAVVVHEHFSKDILSLLTDEKEAEENAVVNSTDINTAGNTTGHMATANSTLQTSNGKDAIKDGNTADGADEADQTKSDDDEQQNDDVVVAGKR
jgi:hypothetical protein